MVGAKWQLVGALVALVVHPGPGPARRATPSPSTEAAAETARAGIAKGNAAYIDAFARSDAVALAKVYAPDGARLGEKGHVSHGRAAIAEEVRELVGRVGAVAVTLETVAVWVIGATAYETGTWSYRFTPKGRSESRIGGRYVTVWSRQSNGDWLIQADLGVPGT